MPGGPRVWVLCWWVAGATARGWRSWLVLSEDQSRLPLCVGWPARCRVYRLLAFAPLPPSVGPSVVCLQCPMGGVCVPLDATAVLGPVCSSGCCRSWSGTCVPLCSLVAVTFLGSVCPSAASVAAVGLGSGCPGWHYVLLPLVGAFVPRYGLVLLACFRLGKYALHGMCCLCSLCCCGWSGA